MLSRWRRNKVVKKRRKGIRTIIYDEERKEGRKEETFKVNSNSKEGARIIIRVHPRSHATAN